MHDSFFLTDWLYQAMQLIYKMFDGSSLKAGYAVFITIAIATIILKGITVFSDINMRKYSRNMTALQPQINKIKERYGDDPKRMQQEQSRLMKENGVSALGGCLPMLIMLPLFFMFVAAFRTWSNERMLHLLLTMEQNPEAGLALFKNYQFLWVNNIWRPDSFFALQGCSISTPVSSVLNGEEFFRVFSVLKFDKLKVNPEYIQLLQRLHFFEPGSTTVVTATGNTAFIEAYNKIMAPAMEVWVGKNNGWCILPLLAGGTTLLSSWISTKNQPKPAEGQPGTGKMLTYLMPLMFTFFCLSYDASFALYCLISNIVSLGVTLLINAAFRRQDKNLKPEVVK
jgi:YidC/Oxa1 family membrane protein insertase